MVANEVFVVTIPNAAVLHLANGTSVSLRTIPENALELWKAGESCFALRKSGAYVLEDMSLDELQNILQKREAFASKVELGILKAAIKKATKSK